MSDPVVTQPASRFDRGFLGHPTGLGVLLGTKALERFSYYGMQSLLVLYMTKHLLVPGKIENVWGMQEVQAALGGVQGYALTSSLFGIYAGLIYLGPIAGGYVSDRWIGRHYAVVTGALIMAIGFFQLMFVQTALLALLFLVFGTALFKGNLASQVGSLYTAQDQRRTDAFQLYFISVSVGGLLAPLIIGTVGEKAGWSLGFGSAGVGMLAGIGVYLLGLSRLPAGQPQHHKLEKPESSSSGADDSARLHLLFLVLPIFALVLIPNSQIFNAYMVWADREFALELNGFRIPTSWLMFLDGTVGLLVLVLISWFWRRWQRAYAAPDEVWKILIGCGFSIASMTVLASAALSQEPGTKIGLSVPILFHIFNASAFAHILPSMLSLVSRIAPASLSATSIGLYYLAFFTANLLTGWIGRYFELMPTSTFWLMHAVIGAVAMLGFIGIQRILRNELARYSTKSSATPTPQELADVNATR